MSVAEDVGAAASEASEWDSRKREERLAILFFLLFALYFSFLFFLFPLFFIGYVWRIAGERALGWHPSVEGLMLGHDQQWSNTKMMEQKKARARLILADLTNLRTALKPCAPVSHAEFYALSADLLDQLVPMCSNLLMHGRSLAESNSH